MACGNNKISRSYLSSQPVTTSPLAAVRARLPNEQGQDRLKADFWFTTAGTFEDPSHTLRQHADVDTPGEPRWAFAPQPGQTTKAYTHATGRAGWLGPQAVVDRLPSDAQKALAGRRVIVLGKDATQVWVNERATTFDSQHRTQTTVVRQPKR